MKYQKANCLNCQSPFTKKRTWHTFCSKGCRTEHFWKTHKVVSVANTAETSTNVETTLGQSE